MKQTNNNFITVQRSESIWAFIGFRFWSTIILRLIKAELDLLSQPPRVQTLVDKQSSVDVLNGHILLLNNIIQ